MWTKQTPGQPQSQPQPQTQPSAINPGSFQRTPDATSGRQRIFQPPGPRPRRAAWPVSAPAWKSRAASAAKRIYRSTAKSEGPISIRGHRLTVGRSGQVTSEVSARELVVYGRVSGNVNATDRVEIKKDGAVTGDIQTTRISIEDGAIFKGRIEIDRPGSKPAPKLEPAGLLVGAGAD